MWRYPDPTYIGAVWVSGLERELEAEMLHVTVKVLKLRNCCALFTRCVVHRVSRFISALHGMPARTSDEKAVCPSVCPSNA